LGRTQEAEAKFRRALELKEYWSSYCALGNLALLRHDQSGVDEAIRNLQRLKQEEEARRMECRSAFVRNDLPTAQARAAELAGSKNPEWARGGHILQALLQAEQGEWGNAARILAEVARSLDPTGDPVHEGPNRSRRAFIRLALGFVAWQARNNATAVEQAREAVRIDPNPQILPRAAFLLSVCNDSATLQLARNLTRGWPSAPLFEASRACIDGEMLLLQDEKDAAISRFQHADTLYPAGRPRDFLGLAYARAGRSSEAAVILRPIGESRAMTWLEPEYQWPGICRVCTEQTLGKV